LVPDDDSYEKPSKNEALGGEVGAGEGTSVQSFRISHIKKRIARNSQTAQLVIHCIEDSNFVSGIQ
jgi:hypothetical protein